MENIMMYFAIAGMITGGLMFLAGSGLLLWGLWLRWHVEPSRRRASQNTAGRTIQSGAARQ